MFPPTSCPPRCSGWIQFLFSEDVQLADLSETLRAVWVHGPAASSMLEEALTGVAGVASWPEYHNTRAEFGGSPVVVARVSQLGVPGFVLYIEPGRQADLQRALVGKGAVVADPETVEAARIEAGYPLFGLDMTEETIPLEAGIEDRAISMTKGCYVGQEVIIPSPSPRAWDGLPGGWWRCACKASSRRRCRRGARGSSPKRVMSAA